LRERVLFLLLLLLAVLLVPLAYWLLFERGMSVGEYPEAEAPQPKAPPITRPAESPGLAPTALSLTEAEGLVEITSGDGPWRPAELGMVLGASDRIRTDNSGRAVLDRPGIFTIELDAGSEFEVQQLTATASRLLLQQGMVSASVRSDPEHAVEIQARGALARSRGGAFRLAIDQQGTISAGSSEGQLEVEAAGRVVVLRSGFQTRVRAGQPPAEPLPVPAKLFLKVNWPEERLLARRKLVLEGSSESGARLRINGELVLVDSRGRFKKALVLKEGKNLIRIDAYDAGGRKTSAQSPEILVDTRPDSFQIRTSPDMWEKKKP
jgi:hypothetical protein